MLACKETAVIHFFALGLAGHRRLPVLGPATNRRRISRRRKVRARRRLRRFLVTGVLLFTWFGQNWAALADLFRAIPNFAARAGGEGHEKPFWYYCELLAGGWSGASIARSGRAGTVFRDAVRVRTAGTSFSGGLRAGHRWSIYSAIPYKTPWLALNFWLPLAILAGFGVEWLWHAAPKFSVRGLILALRRSRLEF